MSAGPRRFEGIRAILFDFDGTLVDSRAAIWGAFEVVLRERGHGVPEPEWMRRRIGRPLRELFAEAIGPLDDPAVESLTAAYRAAFLDHAHLVEALPGAPEVIRHFAPRMPLAIATSRTAEGARLLLGGMGLERAFAAVVGIDDVTRPKPDPEPLHRALEMVGVEPAAALMVGDTPDDILAARRAGVRAVAVATGGHGRDELLACGPDVVLDRLDELIDAVPHGGGASAAQGAR